MNNYQRQAQFDRAQREYDNRLPPDDEPEPEDCPKCEGTGEVEQPATSLFTRLLVWLGWLDLDYDECEECDGEGTIPYKVDEKDYDDSDERIKL